MAQGAEAVDFSSFEPPCLRARSRLPLSSPAPLHFADDSTLRSFDFRPLSPAWRQARSSAQLVLPGAAPAAPQGAKVVPKPRHKSWRPARNGTAAKGGKPACGRDRQPRRAPAHAQRQIGAPADFRRRQVADHRQASTRRRGRLRSSQRCVVDIIGETPIEATNVGRPDGLERFEAKVPACPISFDVLDGAVLAPTQITACVFKAADCQTTPGGLWGPDGASLVGDAAKIVKERAASGKGDGQDPARDRGPRRDSPQAADLVRDQNGFAGQRDELCRDYAKESVHGYCGLRVTEARAALLQTRLDELGPQPRPRRRAKKAKRRSQRRARSSLSRIRRAEARLQRGEPYRFSGICIPRRLDPWSVASRLR